MFSQYESEGPTLRLVIPAGSADPPITIKLATTDVHFGGRLVVRLPRLRASCRNPL